MPNNGHVYFEIDLGRDYQVSKVTFYNRGDGWQCQAQQSKIQLFDANKKKIAESGMINCQHKLALVFTNESCSVKKLLSGTLNRYEALTRYVRLEAALPDLSVAYISVQTPSGQEVSRGKKVTSFRQWNECVDPAVIVNGVAETRSLQDFDKKKGQCSA